MVFRRGDLNARSGRVFVLVSLLLHKFIPGVDSGGLRLNGTTGTGNGNIGTSPGSLPNGNPDSHPQNRESARSDSEMLFAFTSSAHYSHAQSNSPDGEETGNPENYADAVADRKETSEGGIPQLVYHAEIDGSRLTIPAGDGANSNVAIILPTFWPNSNETTMDRRVSDVLDMPWNESNFSRSGKLGEIERQGDHIEHTADGLDRLSPKDKVQKDSEQQPNYEANQPMMDSPHVSAVVVRSTGNKGATQSGENTTTAPDDIIMFPDELMQYEEEESEGGSPVNTYFFIRTPERNRSADNCGPNQRFFRGRCRTYHP